jgi:uncharacterized protein YdgA (DUF945 family)
LKRLLIILLLFIILVASAITGGTFYLGQETEKLYQGLITQLAQNNGLTIGKNDYNKGFFSSRAMTTLSMANTTTKINVSSYIHHGPIIINDILQGKFGDILNPLSTKIYSDIQIIGTANKKPVQLSLPLTTRVDILGSGTVKLDLPATTRKLDNMTLRWPGITGQIAFNKELKTFKSDLNIPRLDITTKTGANITVSGVVYHSETSLGRNHYPLGDYHLSIAQVDIKPFLSIKKMRFESKASERENFINYTIRYNLDAIIVAGKTVGPGQMDIILRRLDAASLTAYEKQNNKLGKTNLNQQQTTIKKIGNFMDLLAMLAKQAPELEITNFNFKTSNGDIISSGKLVLDGKDKELGKNPMQLLAAVNGQVNVAFPPGIIQPLLEPYIRADLEAYSKKGELTQKETEKLTPESVNKIIQQALPLYLDRHPFTKMLSHENNRFIMNIRVESGNIKINGQPWRPKLPTLNLGNRIQDN